MKQRRAVQGSSIFGQVHCREAHTTEVGDIEESKSDIKTMFVIFGFKLKVNKQVMQISTWCLF